MPRTPDIGQLRFTSTLKQGRSVGAAPFSAINNGCRAWVPAESHFADKVAAELDRLIRECARGAGVLHIEEHAVRVLNALGAECGLTIHLQGDPHAIR